MPPKSSVPSTEEIQHTLLAKYEEHKKLLVGVGAVLVVVVVGLIMFLTLSSRAVERNWDEMLSVDRRSPFGAEDTLEGLLDKGGSDVAPFALYKLAVLAKRDEDYDRALELLDRLETEYGDSLLSILPSPDRRYSLPGLLRRRIESERSWEKEHALESPEPNTSRVALVETTKGGFWIGFFPELAPQHVESFVRLAKSGAYNRTKVYVVTGNRIEFGGEATRDDDPMNDEESADETLLDPEPGRYKIAQDRGAVSTVAVEGGESPTRIAVVVGPSDLGLEKKQTVFGKVLTDRGTAMEALDTVKNSPTYGASKDPAHAGDEFRKIPDRPVEPIEILRVSIWSGDSIEDGHDWDTSAVVEPEKAAPVEPEEPEDETGDEEPGSPTEEGKGEDAERETPEEPTPR